MDDKKDEDKGWGEKNYGLGLSIALFAFFLILTPIILLVSKKGEAYS